jgi:hypothetical protein
MSESDALGRCITVPFLVIPDEPLFVCSVLASCACSFGQFGVCLLEYDGAAKTWADECNRNCGLQGPGNTMPRGFGGLKHSRRVTRQATKTLEIFMHFDQPFHIRCPSSRQDQENSGNHCRIQGCNIHEWHCNIYLPRSIRMNSA